MGLRWLCLLLSVTSVLSFAACGDNEHFKFHDAGTDTNGSGSDGGIDAPPDALTCTAPLLKCGNTCVDPRTDNNNCGACSTSCPANNTCQTDGSSTMCCPAGQTNCGGTCVDLTTDEGHCGTCATTCSNGQTCDNGTCCGNGTTVCTTAQGNQCFDLQTDEGHCGACGTACGANQTCDSGICCDNGQINCGGTCVDPNSDEAHCGGCVGSGLPGVACTNTQSCEGGICCTTGLSNCNNTCVDLKTDEANCGTCTTTCATTQTCTTRADTTDPKCCTTGFNNCSGTCSDPLTDNNNCGSCGHACGSGESCSDGVCCGPGQTNCNGTCVDLINDAAHCGTCGTSCVNTATPFCSGAQCTSACGPGETDCSGNCVFTSSDHDNCGGCGIACAANQFCSSGTCTTSCPANTMACNGSCVDVSNDPNHCGNCGTICGPTDECVNGQCQLDCPAGELLCNGSCVNPLQDNAHCSTNPNSCGVACAAGSSCDLGVCCPTGQVNCNGVCKSLTADTSCGSCTNTCTTPGNYCSTIGSDSQCCATGTINCGGATCADPKTDEANCGACGVNCGSGTCDNGKCCPVGTVNTGGICCPTGFINCGNQCFDPKTSTANCGQCGNACGANQYCSNGACNTNCLSPNNLDCGVCTNTLTDPDHCGSICDDCPTGAACNNGTCQTCAQANAATPDECNNACTNLQTDNTNCGVCNTFCGNGESCTSGKCCTTGLDNCNNECVDYNVGIPQVDGTTTDCGGCGAGHTCGVGSTCTNGSCQCPFGQTDCNGQCKTLVTDAQNCGACGNICGQGANVNKPLCVSGSCVATCPAPLINCGGKCINNSDDNSHCSTTPGSCGIACPANTGCSAGACVPVLGPFGTPSKCVGGGPPTVVPDPGGGDICTGNLGAVAFTFGLCSRTQIGGLSQALYTDAFDSTAGAYKASCTTDADCDALHCSKTLGACNGPVNTVSNCPGGSTDLCEYPVKCVLTAPPGGTGVCVGGGVGVNGTITPVASNTANTHVGGDFWVYGLNGLNGAVQTGLAIKGNTQVKQRFFNNGTIDLSKTTHIYGTADVKGGWTSGGGADMTIDGALTTESTCAPLGTNVLHLGAGCTTAAFAGGTTPPCGKVDGSDGSLINVRAIVDFYRDPAHNDNAAIGLPYNILDNPVNTVRLDLPCGYYYFNQMNIGKDTTIVVHGRTALFVGGAMRVSQKLILDLDPTATLDIFVGGVMNVSNQVTLGSPAFPRRSRMYFGSSSCLGSGSCSNPADCCSGICDIPSGQTTGICGAGGGGNLTQAISLSNGGYFNGLLWGGYGQFTHSNPLEMYGSIYANRFDASGDTTVHYDIGATKTAEECPAQPGNSTCESCRDCNNQACVNNTCGACTADSQCCPPLHCEVATGTCKL